MKKQPSHNQDPRDIAPTKRRKFLGASGAGLATLAFPEMLLPRKSLAKDGLKVLPVGVLLEAAAHGAAVHTAVEKQIFERQGLRVERKQYAAGANLIQALAAGDIVAGVCGDNPTLLSKAQGIDIKILANANLEGSVIVVGPDVKSPKDLDGRKVGTPGVAAIQDTLMRLYEQKYGMKTEHVFIRVTDMPAFLRKGEIAGYIIWEVAGTKGVEMSGGRILATSHDILPHHECCVLIASGKFLKNEPDAALRLVRSFAMGLHYDVTHHDDLVQIVAKDDQLSPELAREALTHVQYKYPPVNDLANLAFIVKALIQGNKIDRSSVPDVGRFVADVVDNRMIKSVTA